MSEKNNTITLSQKLPVYISNLGIVGFVATYLVATQIYPGGFHWSEYYWCDLLQSMTFNGRTNTAQIISIIGNSILCISLGLFYYQFAQKMATTPKWKFIIQNTGIASMLGALFIYTEYHDFFISFSSLLGVPAVVGIALALHRNNLRILNYIGSLCVLLFLINNGVFYSSIGIQYLPLIQKITFITVFAFIWITNSHLITISKPS